MTETREKKTTAIYLQVPIQLHLKLKIEAAKKGTSLKKIIIEKLTT